MLSCSFFEGDNTRIHSIYELQEEQENLAGIARFKFCSLCINLRCVNVSISCTEKHFTNQLTDSRKPLVQDLDFVRRSVVKGSF